jgi:hypothetical protein
MDRRLRSASSRRSRCSHKPTCASLHCDMDRVRTKAGGSALALALALTLTFALTPEPVPAGGAAGPALATECGAAANDAAPRNWPPS